MRGQDEDDVGFLGFVVSLVIIFVLWVLVFSVAAAALKG